MNLSSILRAPSAAGSTNFAHKPPDVSARGCGHTSPFIPWRLLCSTFFFFFPELPEHQHIRPPLSLQSSCDAASLSFTASVRYRHTQAGAQTSFQEGLCDGRNKKKGKSAVKNKRLQHRTQQGFCWWVDALSTDNFQETMIALLAFTYISARKQLLL